MFIMIQDNSSIHILHVGGDSQEAVVFLQPVYFLLLDLIIFLFVIFQIIMSSPLFEQGGIFKYQFGFCNTLQSFVTVFAARIADQVPIIRRRSCSIMVYLTTRLFSSFIIHSF